MAELGGVKTRGWGPPTLPDVSEYTPDDHRQAMKYRSFSNESLKGVCRARGVSASGRTAVLVDTLVRSEPGMRNHIQRPCPATKKQLNRIEETAKLRHLVVPPRVRFTAAAAAEWVQEHAPFVPT